MMADIKALKELDYVYKMHYSAFWMDGHKKKSETKIRCFF